MMVPINTPAAGLVSNPFTIKGMTESTGDHAEKGP